MRRITGLLIAVGVCLPVWSAAGNLEVLSSVSERAQTGNALEVTVKCDKKDKIVDALQKNAGKLVIRIQGVCQEDVLIQRDDVVLEGTGPDSAVIGSVVADAAVRVELRGFTVRGTRGIESSAIGAFHGAAVKLENMVVENAEGRGIQIFTSTAVLTNIRVNGAGNVGILIRGSKANFEGDIVSNNSGLAGISITLASSVFSKTGQWSLSGNPIGVIIQENAALEKPGGSIIASNNRRSGIELQTQGTMNYGGTIEANNNQVFGMRLDESASASPFQGFEPVTSFSNNGFTGVFVERNSSVEFAGTTLIQNNRTFGLFVDEAAFRISGATITGNPVDDVRLVFGSKASFEGSPSTVGRIRCDGTSLIRGRTCTPLP